MLNILTFFGRTTLNIAAIAVVALGYYAGKNMYGDDGAAIGGLLGLVVAGTVFGLAAAVYDAQSSLRSLLAIARQNAPTQTL